MAIVKQCTRETNYNERLAKSLPCLVTRIRHRHHHADEKNMRKSDPNKDVKKHTVSDGTTLYD